MSHPQLTVPKRGYLANILNVPPLIYPFQYNPTQISESKANTLRSSTPAATLSSALEATLGFAGAALSLNISAAASGFKTARQKLARTLSNTELYDFNVEGPRKFSFKFVVDGREKRPGEPDRRRSDSGSVLPDLAIIRSFVFPALADLMDLASAALGPTPEGRVFFKKPPTCLLVMGSRSVEGFITDLKITETAFNADLEPTRAEIEIQMTENTDSISFIVDAFKRIGLTAYNSAYEDIGEVLF
ncbi:MAG TPA: hypothetical protein VFG30_41895 [Polyangiales bacterium]|nr:hypothetical protein [Polyangiales bacterium]